AATVSLDDALVLRVVNGVPSRSHRVHVAFRAAVEPLLEGPAPPERPPRPAVDRADADGGFRAADRAGLARHPRISRRRSARKSKISSSQRPTNGRCTTGA